MNTKHLGNRSLISDLVLILPVLGTFFVNPNLLKLNLNLKPSDIPGKAVEKQDSCPLL